MVTHKNLKAWGKAMDFVCEVYRETAKFPKEERFGLMQQLRRSSVSVPSNIAEGSARISRKEYIRFLSISLGSAVELETQLLLSRRLGFISELIVEEMIDELNEIIRMIKGLIYRNQRLIVNNQ